MLHVQALYAAPSTLDLHCLPLATAHHLKHVRDPMLSFQCTSRAESLTHSDTCLHCIAATEHADPTKEAFLLHKLVGKAAAALDSGY